MGRYESIGTSLAETCFSGQLDHWPHPLLGHNAEELALLRAQVYGFLFSKL
jgi:hypothetical protein